MSELSKLTAITRDETGQPGPQNAKERVYEKIRIPLWALDTLIVLLVAAVIVFLVVGSIKGNA